LTSSTSKTFSGLAAGTWYIGLRARDAVGNWSAWRQIRVVVPTDDRSFSFSSSTSRRTGSAYINGTSTWNANAGSKMTARFSGDAFYLIGTAGPEYGKLRVTIDGVSTTVDTGHYKGARASSNHYRVLLFSKAMASGTHTVTITNLATSGRPTIAIDALGFRN
jgi:hypothetical protein